MISKMDKYKLDICFIPFEVYEYMKRENCEIADLPNSIHKMYLKTHVQIERKLNGVHPRRHGILRMNKVFNIRVSSIGNYSNDSCGSVSYLEEISNLDSVDNNRHIDEAFKVLRDGTISLKGFVVTYDPRITIGEIEKLKASLYKEATKELGKDMMFSLTLTNNIV